MVPSLSILLLLSTALSFVAAASSKPPEAVPSTITIVVPPPGTIAGSYGLSFGWEDAGIPSGLYRKISFSIILPDGTSNANGSISSSDTVPFLPAGDLDCTGDFAGSSAAASFNNTQVGVYTLTTNITYGIPTNVTEMNGRTTCLGPFSFQSDILTTKFELVAGSPPPTNSSSAPALDLVSTTFAATGSFTPYPTTPAKSGANYFRASIQIVAGLAILLSLTLVR